MTTPAAIEKFIRQGLISYPDAIVTLGEFQKEIQAPCKKAIETLRRVIGGKPSRKEPQFKPYADPEWLGVELKERSLYLNAGISWDKTKKQGPSWASVGIYFGSMQTARSIRKILADLDEEPDEEYQADETGDEKVAVWLSEGIKTTTLHGVESAIQQCLKGWVRAAPKLQKVLKKTK
jgi:hypothetical protein